MTSPFANTNKSSTGDTETLSLLDLVRTRANEGVLVLDARGRPLNFTPAVPELLGWPAQEVGSSDPAVLPAELDELLRRCLREGAPLSHHPLLLPRAGKRPINLEVSVLPAGTGHDTKLVVSLRDSGMTEKFGRLIDQMDRLASVGTMSAGVCHEIKNALVPVKTLIDLLVKQSTDTEMAELVSRELRRIDSLVSQMLRFAGPAQPVSALFHLHEVLDHTLKLIERQAAASNVTVMREFEAETDLMRGDHYQVQQAFLNLLLNAIESMPAGGRLSVSTTSTRAISPHTPAALSVAVRDSGCGIAPENVARLFEPFFTTKSAGNGLGLAITQRIVREHSGEITVESAADHGTAFTITLPAADGGH